MGMGWIEKEEDNDFPNWTNWNNQQLKSWIRNISSTADTPDLTPVCR